MRTTIFDKTRPVSPVYYSGDVSYLVPSRVYKKVKAIHDAGRVYRLMADKYGINTYWDIVIEEHHGSGTYDTAECSLYYRSGKYVSMTCWARKYPGTHNWKQISTSWFNRRYAK